LREQYKDAFERPYLPGSSIKGALRTILAWHGFQGQKLRLDVEDLRGSRSWAGQTLERKIFGQNPNYDLLRGLQVADSEPQHVERLQIINAQVVTGSEKMGAPIEVEAVRSDTVFTTTLTIDQFLHSQTAEMQLHFGERWRWLEELPQIARAWAADHLRRERDWFRTRKYEPVWRLYHQMLSALNRLPPGQFFLQLGWGGGWTSKTIGYPLQEDEQAWERLLSDKRLSPARIRRRVSDPFPKSRRVIVAAQQVAAPLGWCLVEMKGR
jgi:CRISPR-associated protein Csm5